MVCLFVCFNLSQYLEPILAEVNVNSNSNSNLRDKITISVSVCEVTAVPQTLKSVRPYALSVNQIKQIQAQPIINKMLPQPPKLAIVANCSTGNIPQLQEDMSQSHKSDDDHDHLQHTQTAQGEHNINEIHSEGIDIAFEKDMDVDVREGINDHLGHVDTNGDCVIIYGDDNEHHAEE